MDDDSYDELSGFGDFHRLYVCKQDGIAVADKEAHDAWHGGLRLVADDARWGGMNRPIGGGHHR